MSKEGQPSFMGRGEQLGRQHGGKRGSESRQGDLPRGSEPLKLWVVSVHRKKGEAQNA